MKVKHWTIQAWARDAALAQAAPVVFRAIADLTPAHRARVLRAAAALYPADGNT